MHNLRIIKMTPSMAPSVFFIALAFSWVNATAQNLQTATVAPIEKSATTSLISIRTVSDAARQALTAQDFQKVVDLYQAFNNQADLGSMDHYRLAIAFVRLDRAKDAFSHINKALEMDPKGMFASTPQRLEKILSDIQQGCESLGSQGCLTKKTEPTEVTNPSVEIVASVATPNLTNIPAIPEFKPAKLVTTSPEYSNTSTISEWGSQTLSKLGLNHFALIILCIFMVWRWTIKPKRKSYLDELHHAVQKHLTFCPKDSKLGVKLIDILPLIEQEVGRAQFLKMFDVSKLSKTDKAQAELALKYEKVPMEISTASPKEIQALFQAKRWNV